MKPGEYLLDETVGPIQANVGRRTVRLLVKNTGDRPIQVGSHYHFFEANRALEFDRAAAFGMRILGVDPRCREVPGALPEVWPSARLLDLLRESDFVVIAAPHTPETFKLFRRDKFEVMKSTACLINIGRGAIVDLDDLVAALQAGEIAGAALDVFEVEPLPRDSPLWSMPNVIVTPHIAAASTHIAERHLQTLLENIRRFVAGREPATLVDKRQWF